MKKKKMSAMAVCHGMALFTFFGGVFASSIDILFHGAFIALSRGSSLLIYIGRSIVDGGRAYK